MLITTGKVNLLDLDRRDLESFFVAMGEKAFRATQIMKWIYHEGVTDFAAMTNLSKALRERLVERAEIRPPEVALDQWRHSRNLSPFERKLVLSIRGVVDIYEFAAQLYARTQLVADPNVKTLH